MKPNGKRTDAVRFLENLTKGQKVSLKFDHIKHEKENSLFCYLYLQNKTFVNAYLIKNNLVDVDTKSEYRMKNKFLALISR